MDEREFPVVLELQRHVQDVLNNPVPFSTIMAYVVTKGWNVVDPDLFKEWVKTNFPRSPINYDT